MCKFWINFLYFCKGEDINLAYECIINDELCC